MDIEWPPIKSWTRIVSLEGSHYFVAINYGGNRQNRWVNLVSVLDGDVRTKVNWEEMKDSSIWLIGWKNLDSLRRYRALDKKSITNKTIKPFENCCLHASSDSGLGLPIKVGTIRKWL